jgi:aryl sulfotransferase
MLPQTKHIMQTPQFDSTRWQYYTPRNDDIIISTSPKSGTTWMQTLIMHLIFADLQYRPIDDFSPWLDHHSRTTEQVIGLIEAQTHRRCIKTHLPLDALPYHPQVRYVVVGRDARDVFMALFYFYRNFTQAYIEELDANSNGQGFPKCPDDPREFWRDWMTRGAFPWMSEGYPRVGTLYHMQSWWDYKHLPNIHFVHYNDLLARTEDEIRRVAAFLGIEVSAGFVRQIRESTHIDNMRAKSDMLKPAATQYQDGSQVFFHKGTNGRWRDVLTDDDLKLYTAAAARVLTADCVRWLETGRQALQAAT